jgi:hypothetical protein
MAADERSRGTDEEIVDAADDEFDDDELDDDELDDEDEAADDAE